MKRIRLPHLPGKVVSSKSNESKILSTKDGSIFPVYMCLSSFWNFGAFCKMVSKKTILSETPDQSWYLSLSWDNRRKIEHTDSDNKNKTNISHPFNPPHYFWFTMALSGPDPQQWQIAHLIVSRPINQGGSSPLRQMVKLWLTVPSHWMDVWLCINYLQVCRAKCDIALYWKQNKRTSQFFNL